MRFHTASPSRALAPAIALFAMLSVASGPADAQRRERDGRAVVEAACARCHATGQDNAPRIGDANAWAPRASRGLTALSASALQGIRQMPAHGGSPDVSDIEIERAITYMVNQSGGAWVEPIGGATPALLRSSETVVRTQCAKCHASGEAGAPKIGDRMAWAPRLRRGLEPLVASAVHGHGPMPARGGMPDLSEDEIRGAILHMFNAGLPPTPPQPMTVSKNDDPRHRLVAGTDVYLGLVRAEAMREAARQAGKSDVPSGKGYYHVNISLADHASQVPLTDADVEVRVSDGMRTEKRMLGLVAANNIVSYGNYFRLESGSAYDIVAAIRRPGMPTPIEATFKFKAP